MSAFIVCPDCINSIVTYVTRTRFVSLGFYERLKFDVSSPKELPDSRPLFMALTALRSSSGMETGS